MKKLIILIIVAAIGIAILESEGLYTFGEATAQLKSTWNSIKTFFTT
ncbi:MAG: hypothetical protein ACOC2U_01365 [bacterium]